LFDAMSYYLPAILKMQAVNHLLNLKLSFVHTRKGVDYRSARLGVERFASRQASFKGKLICPISHGGALAFEDAAPARPLRVFRVDDLPGGRCGVTEVLGRDWLRAAYQF
jgi:hypothetical protein